MYNSVDTDIFHKTILFLRVQHTLWSLDHLLCVFDERCKKNRGKQDSHEKYERAQRNAYSLFDMLGLFVIVTSQFITMTVQQSRDALSDHFSALSPNNIWTKNVYHPVHVSSFSTKSTSTLIIHFDEFIYLIILFFFELSNCCNLIAINANMTNINIPVTTRYAKIFKA